jgi:hypothetical protein
MKATHEHPTPRTDTTTVTPGDVLRGAAAYLRRHGWIQGEIFDVLVTGPFPPACAIGAINMAAHGRCTLTADDDTTDPDDVDALTAMRIFAAYLDPDYDPWATSCIDVIGDYNDDRSRSADEVIDALRDAATDYEAMHTTGGAR